MNLAYDEIIERSKEPLFEGVLEDPDIITKDSNPLCGDEIEVFIQMQDNKISNIKFKSRGCSISKVSMDMIAENLIGKTTEEVLQTGNEAILNVIGIKLSAMRVKCALLGLVAIKKGMEKWRNGTGN